MNEGNEFVNKITREIEAFRKEILSDKKRTILEKAYKIDLMFRLHNILCGLAEHITTEHLKYLLKEETNILESMYCSWLKMEDNLHEELKEHVMMEMEKLIEERKQGHGKTYHTAA